MTQPLSLTLSDAALHALTTAVTKARKGSRYWRWPDANEFGAGLQSVGKEPPSPPIIR